jgi:hypothetical protein
MFYADFSARCFGFGPTGAGLSGIIFGYGLAIEHKAAKSGYSWPIAALGGKCGMIQGRTRPVPAYEIIV